MFAAAKIGSHGEEMGRGHQSNCQTQELGCVAAQWPGHMYLNFSWRTTFARVECLALQSCTSLDFVLSPVPMSSHHSIYVMCLFHIVSVGFHHDKHGLLASPFFNTHLFIFTIWCFGRLSRLENRFGKLPCEKPGGKRERGNLETSGK